MSTRIEHRLRSSGFRVLALAATIVVASALSQAQTHVTSVFNGLYAERDTTNESGSCVPVTPTARQTNANGLSLSANLTGGNAKVVVAMSMVLAPTTITGLPTAGSLGLNTLALDSIVDTTLPVEIIPDRDGKHEGTERVRT